MTWLARIFVSAVVRRIAFVLAALLLSAVGVGAARAQASGPGICSQSGLVQTDSGCKDQGVAVAAAQAAATDSLSARSASYPDRSVCGMRPAGTYPNGVGVDICVSKTSPAVLSTFVRYYTAPCSARASLFVGGQIDITTSDVVCGGGCEYKMEPIEKKSLETAGRENIITAKGMHVPTGKACMSPPTPPKKPPPGKVCSETLGGHVFCTRDDGKICVTSATTGRTYCGDASSGTKATNPERTENINIGPPTPSPTPPTPPTPRPGEDWKPRDSATINNTTSNNSNSITINNNAGTPNTGPNNGNPDDGSGNPGDPGNGTGTGTGQGDGEQSGAAGSGVGSLYTAEPMTPAEAIGAYATMALDAPIAQAARDFFGNCSYSGSCPVWSYDGGPMLGLLTFDGFCSPALSELLTWAGYIVMATAAFAAFRIAFF